MFVVIILLANCRSLFLNAFHSSCNPQFHKITFYHYRIFMYISTVHLHQVDNSLISVCVDSRFSFLVNFFLDVCIYKCPNVDAVVDLAEPVIGHLHHHFSCRNLISANYAVRMLSIVAYVHREFDHIFGFQTSITL